MGDEGKIVSTHFCGIVKFQTSVNEMIIVIDMFGIYVYQSNFSPFFPDSVCTEKFTSNLQNTNHSTRRHHHSKPVWSWVSFKHISINDFSI